MLVGCIPIKEPAVAFAAAEQPIASADRARLAEAAAPELREAREELVAGRAAAAERRIESERLTLESRVDADLAAARCEASKAVAVNDEMERSTETLTQEIQRESGAP